MFNHSDFFFFQFFFQNQDMKVGISFIPPHYSVLVELITPRLNFELRWVLGKVTNFFPYKPNS